MYNFTQNVRFSTMSKAVEITNWPQTVVEIGSIRDKSPRSHEGEGHSTLFWCQHCPLVYSIDIDPKATQITEEICGWGGENKGFHGFRGITSDGIEWLEQFDDPIDILYLDAWDSGTPNYQENHVTAYRAAQKNLKRDSVILIDDTWVLKGDGKGVLVVEQALKDGWQIAAHEYQVLLQMT